MPPTAQERAARREYLAQLGLTPIPYSRRSPCPRCNALVGDPCVASGSGRVLANHHSVRFDAVRRETLSRTSRLVLLTDDPRFGLVKGDILIGHPYAFDSKWTILFRESDGFDPGCNQYASDVAWIGWAPAPAAA